MSFLRYILLACGVSIFISCGGESSPGVANSSTGYPNTGSYGGSEPPSGDLPPASTPNNPASTPSNPPAVNVAELNAFRDTFHPVLNSTCNTCHGESGDYTKFGVGDAASSYSIIKARNLVDLSNPASSKLVTYVVDRHNCGNNCAAIETSFLQAIGEWNNRLGNAATPPAPNPAPNPAPTPVADPSPEPPVPVVLNAEEKAFAENFYPILRENCSGCHSELENSATDGIDLPKFAHVNPAVAHAVTVNRALVNFQAPENSRLLYRVAADEHACWTDCNNDAATVLQSINAWKAAKPNGAPSPSPVVNPPVEPPLTPSKQESVAAFERSVWPIVRANCAGCHSGSIAAASVFAGANVEASHDITLARNIANVGNPSESILVKYLRDRLHSCWPSTAECSANASAMEAAVALWQEIIKQNNPNLGNSAPVAVADRYQTLQETVLVTGLVTQNDNDADADDTLAIVAFDNMSANGGTVQDNGNGTFTYSPPIGFLGEDSFVYTIADIAGEMASAVVVIEVQALPKVVAADDDIEGSFNTTITLNNLLENDMGPAGRALNIVTVQTNTDQGGRATRDQNVVSYIPPADFKGTDSFAYSITDGISFANAVVRITINAEPVALADGEYTHTGVRLVTRNVLLNDRDLNNDVLTITSFDASGTRGAVTYNNDGTFTYDPPNAVVKDSFTYQVSDGRGGLDSGEVFINVIAPVFKDDDRFLQFLNQTTPSAEENAQSAAAYYAAIDPANRRTTLEDFRNVNGFNVGADAFALYINDNDLGFSRRMFVRADPLSNSVASYVENYPNLQSALNAANGDRSGLIATVAMEYTVAPGKDVNDPNEELYTTFYVFNPNGNRVGSADLDGRGEKFVPGLCNTCHGGGPKALVNGAYPDNGNTGARWIPWDVDTFAFTDDTTTVPIDQNAFKILNQAILKTDATDAVVDTIHGWYGGPNLPNNNFFGGAIPQGWSPPEAPAEATQLFTQVVKPYCRACHAQRGSEAEFNISFHSYQQFMAYAERSNELVFDEATMPMALRTYDRFWAQPNSAEILARALKSNRLLKNQAIVTPGRPVAKAGPSREAALGVVSLNGSASVHVGSGANAFEWQLIAPAGSTAVLSNTNSASPTFTADLPGEYRARLQVNDDDPATPSSPISEVIIQVSGQVQPTSFAAHVVPIFNKCSGCHKGFDNPRFDTPDILHRKVIEYVDKNDIANSKILTKPAGVNHAGGVVSGFESVTGTEFNILLRWIAEGANDN